MLSAINSVAMALMVGSREVRTMPHTRVGKVLPPPMVKKVMTKSSSEIASAISAAPTMVGRMIGSVTVRNAVQRRGAEVAGAVDDRAVEARHARIDDEDHEGLRDHQLARGSRSESEAEIEQTDEDS